MAHQGSFSSSHSSQSPHISTPASTSSMVSGAASMTNTTFSIFQEGPGQQLVYSPPRGTPELQALVDQFISLDIPVSMKMEMIQRDFESHFQRTGDRYKTYIVPTAATPVAFTASPSPVFPNTMETVSYQSQSGPENYLAFLDSSPSDAGLTDSLYALSLPVINSAQTSDMLPYTASSVSTAWLTGMPTTAPLASTTSVIDWAVQPRKRQTSQTANRSMQILTRDGEDITNLSSRTTRTNQERESTRIVRQRGACASCRRKKIRCDPGHIGRSTSSANRSTPYAAAAMSGRAKEEMLADKAAKAAQAKRESKKPVTTADPMIMAPQTAAALSALWVDNSSCQDTVSFSATDSFSLDLNMLQDSFDWSSLTTEEIDQQIAAALAIDDTASAVLPQPHVPRVPGPEPVHAVARRQEAGESSGAQVKTSDGLPDLPIPPDRPSPSASAAVLETLETQETQFGLDNSDGSLSHRSSQSSSSMSTAVGQPQTLPVPDVPVVERERERERLRRHRRTLQNGQTGELSAVISSSASQQETVQTSEIGGGENGLSYRSQSESVMAQGLLDMASLYAGMAALASSLLPSLLVWASSRAVEKSTTDMESGMERLNLGSTLVSCQ